MIQGAWDNSGNEYSRIPSTEGGMSPLPAGGYDALNAQDFIAQHNEASGFSVLDSAQEALMSEMELNSHQESAGSPNKKGLHIISKNEPDKHFEIDQTSGYLVEKAPGFLSEFSGNLGHGQFIYDSVAKAKTNQILAKAGQLHADKMARVSKASSLESARDVFKTQSSQSYKYLDKALNSKGYKLVSKGITALNAAYVGAEGYKAYAANRSSSENIKWRETAAATVGAAADVVAGNVNAAAWTYAGATLGAPVPLVGAVIGGAIGYGVGAYVYNHAEINKAIFSSASFAAKTSWNYVHNLFWSKS